MSNFHSLSNKIDLQQIACMWLGKCWFLIYTVLVQGACIIVDGKFWRSNKSLFLKDSKEIHGNGTPSINVGAQPYEHTSIEPLKLNMLTQMLITCANC